MNTYKIRMISDNYQEVYTVVADDYRWDERTHSTQYEFVNYTDEGTVRVALYSASPRHTVMITKAGLPTV